MPYNNYKLIDSEGEYQINGSDLDNDIQGWVDNVKDTKIRMKMADGSTKDIPLSQYQSARQNGAKAWTYGTKSVQRKSQPQKPQRQAKTTYGIPYGQESKLTPAKPQAPTPVHTPAWQQMHQGSAWQPMSHEEYRGQKVDERTTGIPFRNVPQQTAATEHAKTVQQGRAWEARTPFAKSVVDSEDFEAVADMPNMNQKEYEEFVKNNPMAYAAAVNGTQLPLRTVHQQVAENNRILAEDIQQFGSAFDQAFDEQRRAQIEAAGQEYKDSWKADGFWETLFSAGASGNQGLQMQRIGDLNKKYDPEVFALKTALDELEQQTSGIDKNRRARLASALYERIKNKLIEEQRNPEALGFILNGIKDSTMMQLAMGSMRTDYQNMIAQLAKEKDYSEENLAQSVFRGALSFAMDMPLYELTGGMGAGTAAGLGWVKKKLMQKVLKDLIARGVEKKAAQRAATFVAERAADTWKNKAMMAAGATVKRGVQAGITFGAADFVKGGALQTVKPLTYKDEEGNTMFLADYVTQNNLSDEDTKALYAKAMAEQRSFGAITEAAWEEGRRGAVSGAATGFAAVPTTLIGYGQGWGRKLLGDLIGFETEVAGMTTADVVMAAQDGEATDWWDTFWQTEANLGVFKIKPTMSSIFTRREGGQRIADHHIFRNIKSNLADMSARGRIEQGMMFTKQELDHMKANRPNLVNVVGDLMQSASKLDKTFNGTDQLNMSDLKKELASFIADPNMTEVEKQKMLYRLTGKVMKTSDVDDIEIDGTTLRLLNEDKGVISEQTYATEYEATLAALDHRIDMETNRRKNIRLAALEHETDLNFETWLEADVAELKNKTKLTDEEKALIEVFDNLEAAKEAHATKAEDRTEEQQKLNDKLVNAFRAMAKKHATVDKQVREAICKEYGISGEQLDAAVAGHTTTEAEKLMKEQDKEDDRVGIIGIGKGKSRTTKEESIVRAYDNALKEATTKVYALNKIKGKLNEAATPDDAETASKPVTTESGEEVQPAQRESVKNGVLAALQEGSTRVPELHSIKLKTDRAAEMLKQNDIDVMDDETLNKIASDEAYNPEIRQACKDMLEGREAMKGADDAISAFVEEMGNAEEQRLELLQEVNTEKMGNGMVTTAMMPKPGTTNDKVKVYVKTELMRDEEENIDLDPESLIKVMDEQGNEYTIKAGTLDTGTLMSEHYSDAVKRFKQQRKAEMQQTIAAMNEGGEIDLANDRFTTEDGKEIQIVNPAPDEQGKIDVRIDGKDGSMTMGELKVARDRAVMMGMQAKEQAEANREALEKEAAEKKAEAAATAPEKTETPKTPSKIDKIPTDEKGEPLFHKADPVDAYDAMVEAFGDEKTAQTDIKVQIKAIEDEIKKTEKTLPKAGLSFSERVEFNNNNKARIEELKNKLAAYKEILNTPKNRVQKLDAEKAERQKVVDTAKATAEKSMKKPVVKTEEEQKAEVKVAAEELTAKHETRAEAEDELRTLRTSIRNQQEADNKRVLDIDDAMKAHVEGKAILTDEQIKALAEERAELQQNIRNASEVLDTYDRIEKEAGKEYSKREWNAMTEEERRNYTLSSITSADELLKKAREIYAAYGLDHLFTDDVQTIEDLIARNLPNKSMRWEDKEVEGGKSRAGVRSHMGGKNATRGIGREATSYPVNTFLADGEGGKTWDEIVHDIYESPENQLENGEHRWETDEISNALDELFRTIEKPSDLRTAGIRKAIDMAEDEVKRMEDEAQYMEGGFDEAPEYDESQLPGGGTIDDAPFSIKTENEGNEIYGLQRGNKDGKGNNILSAIPRETQVLLDTIGKQLGYTISIEEFADEGLTELGKRKITLSLSEAMMQPENVAQRVIGHELTHAMKELSKDRPELWEGYLKMIRVAVGDEIFDTAVRKRKALYDSRFAELRKEDPEKWGRLKDITLDGAAEEVASDFAGLNIFSDKQFVKDLLDHVEKSSESSQGIAKRVLNYISAMLARLKAIIGTRRMTAEEERMMTALEGARNIWKGMYEYAAAKHRAEELKAQAGNKIEPDAEVHLSLSKDLDEKYPDWRNQERKKGGHNTQISGTTKTYKKIGEHLLAQGGGKETILDASSGLGLGTQALREMGYAVDDVEPFQSSDRTESKNGLLPATYDSYNKIDKQYDVVLSNAVLNVIPDDWRRDVLHQMAKAVKVGGKMIVNVRGRSEVAGIKNKIELDDQYELLIPKGKNERGQQTYAYQKFFSKEELRDYIQNELGGNWDVEIGNEANTGTTSGTVAVATKKAEKDMSEEYDQEGYKFVKSSNGTTSFGYVDKKTGLSTAPIKLSEGNSDHGKIHLEARHGSQIRNAGFDSVESFVEFVSQNYTQIKEGVDEGGNPNGTYLLQALDSHNNLLYIQLSKDGSYWNVNSGGVFRKGYGKNMKTVWSASEVQNNGSASIVNALQSKPNTDDGSTSNGTASSDLLGGKGTENNPNNQTKAEKFSITPEKNAEYLSAVEKGDTKKAEEMVKEAAKAAMPETKVVDEKGEPLKVYHRTNATEFVNKKTGQKYDDLDWQERDYWQNEATDEEWNDTWEERDFNVFNADKARRSVEVPGFFFAPEEFEDEGYGKRRIGAYLNIKNPIVDPDFRAMGFDRGTTDTVMEEAMRYLESQGYDGIINTEDSKPYEYIAFKPEQIKSADAVTRDDAGNVIPLSERFNEKKEDIRFSVKKTKGDKTEFKYEDDDVMNLWHGSAADIDHFDHRFFRTGEGSMVYGAGHYASNVEGTGRLYANIATENRQRSNTPMIEWKGQRVDFSDANPLRMAFDVVDSSRTIAEARQRADRYRDLAEEQEMKDKWQAAYDILKQSKKSDFKKLPVRGNRHLYQVEVPADNGKNYIDWNGELDKGIRKQIEDKLINEEGYPEYARPYLFYDGIIELLAEKEYSDQEELRNYLIENDYLLGDKSKYSSIFRTLSRYYEQDEISDMLSEMGIVGVKVPTGNNQGGDGRGMNYVIFKDDDIRIKDHIRFSVSDKDKTLMGVHNLTAENLRHVLKMGGLANPSTAVINTEVGGMNNFGEISLVMPSSLVAKKTGRNAGTWSSDAYTPRYPKGSIVYTTTTKGDKYLRSILDRVGAGDKTYQLLDRVKNHGKDRYDGLGASLHLKRAFLQDKGINVDVHKKGKYSAEDVKTIEENAYTPADKYGRRYIDVRDASEDRVEKIAEVYKANLGDNFEWNKQLLLKQYQPKDDAPDWVKADYERDRADIEKYGATKMKLEDFASDVLRDARYAGELDDYETADSANKAIEDNNLQKEYEQFIDDVWKGMEVEEKIFDGYTPSGNRRYKAHTLENISKMMKKEGRAGSESFFNTSVGALRAKVSPVFSTLEQMRKNKGRIVSSEEFEKTKQEINDEFNELRSLVEGDMSGDEGFYRLEEAMKHGAQWLNLKYDDLNLDKEDIARIETFRELLRNAPTEYFETKFERPVMLNEFAGAVVPKGTDADIVKALRSAGLNITEYDPKVEGDRERATKEASNQEGVRFSISVQKADPFYSNAAKAVEGIKQEKATAEQWLKMIEKAGGLKKGEDKWMGLSEWLKQQNAMAMLGDRSKTLTKQEVMDFISKNAIKIEEVNYNDKGNVSFDYNSENGHYELYGDENTYYKNDGYTYNAYVKGEEIGTYYNEREAQNAINSKLGGSKQINETRLTYITRGLENKKEIALTVPTIEPYNETDNVHFGDAGEGRAVAWVRFGDATDADGYKTLVIDEVQSKRHQDGREKGYKEDVEVKGNVGNYEKVTDKLAYADVTKDDGIMIGQVMRQNGKYIALDQRRQRIDFNRYDTEAEALAKIEENAGLDPDSTHIPDAPFDKNWHELAMKRMLRYAAENGYDKVAWTTGVQQAERYGIGTVVNRIEVEDNFGNDKPMTLYMTNGEDRLMVSPSGIVKDAEGMSLPFDAVGKNLSEIVGVELAKDIMSTEGSRTIEGEELNIGGEGMKGFYDQMLPKFMQKYGKKWGAKVGEVELNLPNEADRKMWSVDVTDSMRESVMEGQPMFSISKQVNDEFNKKLATLTEKNADSVVLNLGKPSDILVKAGLEDKEMKLYGSKVIKKMKKHGFALAELNNLPDAVAEPIAVFNNYKKEGNRSILTELKTAQGNFLVSVECGKGMDLDFNIVSSVFGKGDQNIIDWLKKGSATYINNEKVQNFLHLATPIVAASGKSELSSDAKVQDYFELNKLLGEKLYIRTNNFKNWFGDWEKDPENASKVVDENGEPMVVLHGTNHYGFNIFNERENGIYFTDADDTADYYYDKGVGDAYKVYLNIKNPFVYDAAGRNFGDLPKTINGITLDKTNVGSYYAEIEDWARYIKAHPELGYDGLIIKRVNDSEPERGLSTTYVAFKPKQIKSATGNNSDFDGNNPDIRYSLSARQKDTDNELLDMARSIAKENRAKRERERVNTNPTEAQKAAGNYKHGHKKVDGYDISIENPKGSTRSGKDADGKEWSIKMQHDYGYIRGTEGVDGDHIDVYLSDNPESGNVYVVDQIDQKTGAFDEHKVMYGFDSREEAEKAYLEQYQEGWKMGTMTEVSKDEFRKWVNSSHRKTKAFADYKSVKAVGDGIRYSLIGERGARNLDLLDEAKLISQHNKEEKKNRLDNKAIAEQMEKEGKDANAIWLATGWNKGKDGKWRYEIDDMRMSDEKYREFISMDVPEDQPEGNDWEHKMKLGDLVDAKELFAAYPVLKDMDVVFEYGWSPNKHGVFNASDNAIRLNKSLVTEFGLGKDAEPLNKQLVEDTMIHEIQHAIQHLEDFAKGGNVGMKLSGEDIASNLSVSEHAKYKEIVKRMVEIDRESQEAMDKYDETGDESYMQKSFDMQQEYDSLEEKADKMLEGIKRNLGIKGKLTFDDYRRLAGEVEARNATERNGRGEFWRKENAPSETEDINREEQIVRFSFGSGNAAADDATRALLIKDIKAMIDDDALSTINKRELTRLMNQVRNAKAGELEKAVRNARNIALPMKMKANERRIADFLALKTRDKNGKGMAIGKNVTPETAAALKMVKGRLADIAVTAYDDERRALNQENRNLMAQNRMNEERKQYTSNITPEEIARLDQEIEANNRKIEENKARMTELKTLIEQARLDNLEASKRTVAAQKQVLEDKMNKYVAGEGRWTTIDNAQWAALDILAKRETMMDIESQIEALLEQRKEATGRKKDVIDTEITGARDHFVQAQGELLNMLKDLVDTGRKGLQARKSAQIEHARAVMRGMASSIRGKEISKDHAELTKREKSSWGKSLFTKPLYSLDYMAQAADVNHLGHDGWLYKEFVMGEHGVLAAENTYLTGFRESIGILNDKVREIYGKDLEYVMKENQNVDQNSGIYVLERVDEGADENGVHQYTEERVQMPMSKAQATYIYMVWKMADGRAKLENQGFDEESMEQIEQFIGTANVEWADWVQSEYLQNLRDKYNQKYLEVHGTNMANIQNYVPLNILKASIREQNDYNGDKARTTGMDKKVGALIERTHNLNPVDLTTDAFSIIVDHVNKMEEFNAFADVRRDAEILTNSQWVRNQMNANTAGSFNDFKAALGVALHVDTPETQKGVDIAITKLTKGLVAGNIAFRNTTALKQILSVPAFYGYSQDPRFIAALTKNIAGGYGRNAGAVLANMVSFGFANKKMIDNLDNGTSILMGKNMQWCMENMPSFRERVTKGLSGLEELADSFGKNKVGEWLDKYAKQGMSTNQLVDAITCSIGIKTIHDYKYARLIEQGVEPDEAHRLALMDADVYYNGTQQSNHKTFLSPMQMSRSAMDRALMVYQNASIGFARKAAIACQDLATVTKRNKIINTYAKEYERQGMDADEARKKATETVNNRQRKAAASLVMYGMLTNLLWDLGSKGLIGLFMSDDDKKYLVSIPALMSYPFRGMPGTRIISELAKGGIKNPQMLWSELESTSKDVNDFVEKFGIVSPEVGIWVLNRGMRMAGVTPETWINTAYGISDMVGKGLIKHEDIDVMTDLMFLLQTPNTNRVSVAKQLYKDKSPEEFVRSVIYASKYFDESDATHLLPGMKTLTTKKVDEIIDEMLKGSLTKKQLEELEKKDNYVKEELKRHRTSKELARKFDTETDEVKRAEIAKELRKSWLQEDLEGVDLADRIQKRQKALEGKLNPEKKKDSIYRTSITAADLRKDDIIKEAMSKLQKVYSEYYSIDDKKVAEYEMVHGAELEQYNRIIDIRNEINDLKDDLSEDPSRKAEIMREIAKLRDKAVMIIEGQRKR